MLDSIDQRVWRAAAELDLAEEPVTADRVATRTDVATRVINASLRRLIDAGHLRRRGAEIDVMRLPAAMAAPVATPRKTIPAPTLARLMAGR